MAAVSKKEDAKAESKNGARYEAMRNQKVRNPNRGTKRDGGGRKTSR